jgi:hypothetical protein
LCDRTLDRCADWVIEMETVSEQVPGIVSLL